MPNPCVLLPSPPSAASHSPPSPLTAPRFSSPASHLSLASRPFLPLSPHLSTIPPSFPSSPPYFPSFFLSPPLLPSRPRPSSPNPLSPHRPFLFTHSPPPPQVRSVSEVEQVSTLVKLLRSTSHNGYPVLASGGNPTVGSLPPQAALDQMLITEA